MNIYLQIFFHTLPTLILLGFFLVKQERRLTRLEESTKWISGYIQNLPCVKDPKHYQQNQITTKAQ